VRTWRYFSNQREPCFVVFDSDISTQTSSRCRRDGLVGVIANTNTDHCWPAIVCSGEAAPARFNPGTTGQIAYYPANGLQQ